MIEKITDNNGGIYMKRSIRTLTVTLGLCLALLTGCGSKAATTETTKVTDTTETTVAATETSTSTGEVSDTLKKLREQGYITVGSSNDAPLSYINLDTNEYTGVDGDIFKEVMKRLGVNEVKMKQIPFENLLLELNNKAIDIVVDAMYIKPARQEIARFTNVWYTEGDGLIVKTDSTIASLDDLKDKVVGAQKGTSFLDIANKWKEEGKVKDVIVMSSQAELLLAVNTDKVDACVTDSIIAGYSLTQDSSLDLKLAENYVPDSSGKIGAALRLDDIAFTAEINAVLDEMKKDGSLMKFLEAYGMNESAFVGVEDGQIVQ